MSNAPLLTLIDVRKTVPGGRTLFDGLAMELRSGELVAIMGESGVGKSTLLNLVAGLDTPDTGSVVVDGSDLAMMNEDARAALRRERIGFVFQAFHILPHLTLGQNVGLPLALLRAPLAEVRRRAAQLLSAVGLAGREADYPSQLSGGELQRVAIARALAHRPALLLADEPTGNLDPDGGHGVDAAHRAAPASRRGGAARHPFRCCCGQRRPGCASDRHRPRSRVNVSGDWRAATVPRWMVVGEWRAHPVRIVTAIIAIAIGVALGFAVHLVNASALDRFARGLATVNGGADLRIEAAGGRGFGEDLYTKVARVPGVAAASLSSGYAPGSETERSIFSA